PASWRRRATGVPFARGDGDSVRTLIRLSRGAAWSVDAEYSCVMSARKLFYSLPFALALAPAAHAAGGPAACEALSAPGPFASTTVSSAKIVAANAGQHLPAYCEVTASVRPVEGSNITVVYR